MTELERLALIAYLAERTPGRWLGRTALMKFCYLLKVIRGLPLEYRFTLYSYGPFDSAVLTDLGSAEALGLVKSTFQPYASGYGYRIESLLRLDEAEELAGGLVRDHHSDFEWLMENFGNKNSAELELDTTIVFMDRDAAFKNRALAIDDLTRKVLEVKPHFSGEAIKRAAVSLQEKDLLKAS